MASDIGKAPDLGVDWQLEAVQAAQLQRQLLEQELAARQAILNQTVKERETDRVLTIVHTGLTFLLAAAAVALSCTGLPAPAGVALAAGLAQGAASYRALGLRQRSISSSSANRPHYERASPDAPL